MPDPASDSRLYAYGFLIALGGALGFAFYALHLGRLEIAGGAFASALALMASPPAHRPSPMGDLIRLAPAAVRLEEKTATPPAIPPALILLVTLGLALAGCASTLPSQRQLSALHTQALRKCQDGTAAVCAALVPCSNSLRAAKWQWQRAQRLQAGLPADPPGAVLPADVGPAPLDFELAEAGALLMGYEARRLCADQGVK